jgi:circadian clock protein KaiB
MTMSDKARPRKTSATEAMEEAVAKAGEEKYVLKLYITGMTARSQQALRNIKKIIEENPDNNFDLEVIDIYQQPKLAKGDQIIAVPTLVKKLPLPLRRMIGDLSQEDRIILGLDLKPRVPPPPPQTQGKKKTEK